MAVISVTVTQQSSTASLGMARQHSVMIDRPEAKGGTDQGAMGGEWFLVALGGCFMSNLLEAVRSRGANIGHLVVTIHGTLDGNPPRYSAVEMQVAGETDDADMFEKLVTISERSCIVANTIRTAVDIKIVVEPIFAT